MSDSLQRLAVRAKARASTRLRYLVLMPAAWLMGLNGAKAAPSPTSNEQASYYPSYVQPIFNRSCVTCHGEKKSKGELQLHTFADLARGGASGTSVVAGSPDKSELYRRITLPSDHDEVMPSDGKKLLSAGQIAVIARWIKTGASADAVLPPGDEVLAAAEVAPEPIAPDYRAFRAQLSALEKALPVRLVPVSQSVTDGLILRTASASSRVDDAIIAQLAPVAMFVVDAELSRTNITDAALVSLSQFTNLRRLDLSHTRVTSAGIAHLVGLQKLQALNLVETSVDDAALGALRQMPALKRIHDYGTRMSAVSVP